MPRKMPRNSLPPFLKKLRQITETVSPDIASWSDDGRAFIIHKKEFETDVLTQHFKGNVQTFVRQLHFYGFRKFENPKDIETRYKTKPKTKSSAKSSQKSSSKSPSKSSKSAGSSLSGGNGEYAFAFAHDYFRRDQPHLIFAIKRKTRADNLGMDTVVTSGEIRSISKFMYTVHVCVR